MPRILAAVGPQDSVHLQCGPPRPPSATNMAAVSLPHCVASGVAGSRGHLRDAGKRGGGMLAFRGFRYSLRAPPPLWSRAVRKGILMAAVARQSSSGERLAGAAATLQKRGNAAAVAQYYLKDLTVAGHRCRLKQPGKCDRGGP
jgi:hypothetical protein